MNTDITFCANNEQCSEQHTCQRSLTTSEAFTLIRQTQKPHLSYADFEPEKGANCIGFKMGEVQL